ncbi:MAG: transposase [Nitrospirae bacterium]|nr:transposase [Nitrospirota bacterium]
MNEKKLNTEEGRKIYGKRKILAEPVFGQIKVVGGLTQFLLRGLEKVRTEWKMSAVAHNLLKITRRIMEGKVRDCLTNCVSSIFTVSYPQTI